MFEIAGIVALVAIAIVWLLTFVNMRGVGEAGFISLITTILKLIPLILVALVGLFVLDLGNFSPVNTSGEGAAAAIAASAALTLWAFLGMESATVPAGNVDRPEITIPRATILGTTVAAALYIAVTVASFGVIPPSELTGSTAPEIGPAAHG